MQLTDKERLQYALLYKILDNMNPNEGYDTYVKALESGFEYHYRDIFSQIDNDVLTSQQCKEIIDILNMYRALYFGYKRFKDEINDSELEEKSKFQGFDGNYEIKELSYVEYFVDDLKRFQEIKEYRNGYNSHKELLKDYKGMLKIFLNLTSEQKIKLSKEKLLEILSIAPNAYI
ncbi:MAG: hypothetical protein RIR48_3599 [Bacteroidota bacterium]|jgi:uncharacterized protein YfbU (UPF0304 family)